MGDSQIVLAKKKRLQKTLYLLPFALVAGLTVGLVFNLKLGLIVCFLLLWMWGVCSYIALMHYLAAKDRSFTNKH